MVIYILDDVRQIKSIFVSEMLIILECRFSTKVRFEV